MWFGEVVRMINIYFYRFHRIFSIDIQAWVWNEKKLNIKGTCWKI